MNKITTLLGAVFIASLSMTHLFAQDLKHCGTTEMMQKALDADPLLRQRYIAEEQASELRDQAAFANGDKEEGTNRAMPPV